MTQPGVLYQLSLHSEVRSVKLSTCYPGTSYDTVLSVYSSDQCLAGNDDTGNGLCSTVSFNTRASNYHVLVHGFGAGDFKLTADCSKEELRWASQTKSYLSRSLVNTAGFADVYV